MKILALFFILATFMLTSSVLADTKCEINGHCEKPLVCNPGKICARRCKEKSDCPTEYGTWRCIDRVCQRGYISYPWENEHGFIQSFSSPSSSGTECTDKSDCPYRHVCWHDHKCHSVIEVMEGVTPEPDYGEGPNPEW